MNQASHLVIFRNNKSQVLLTRRADMPLWVIPGGQIEYDETAEHAAIREIKEEIGVACTIVKKVAIYIGSNVTKHLFEGVISDNSIPGTSNEVTEVKWFNVSSLPFEMLVFEQERVRDALTAKAEPLKKQFKIDSKFELKRFSSKPIYLFRLLFRLFLSKIN